MMLAQVLLAAPMRLSAAPTSRPSGPRRPVRCAAKPEQAVPVSTALSRRQLSLASAAALASVTLAHPAIAAPTKGDAAPSFSLPATTGEELSLTKLVGSGKWTVLYFYNQVTN